MQTLVTILISVSIIMLVALVFLAPYALAKKRKYGFTFIPQGEILPVMNGESCTGYLSKLGGWYVADNGQVLKGENPKFDLLRLYHNWFGVYFYGVPPFRKLWEGEFSWVKWMKEGGKDVLVERAARSIDSIYFQFPYGYRFGGLETTPADPATQTGNKDHRSSLVIPVFLEKLFDVRAANVHTMVFPEVTWLTQLVAMMEGVLRPQVGQQSYENLVSADPLAKGGIVEQIMRALCGNPGVINGKQYDPVELAKKQFDDTRFTDDEINRIIAGMPVVVETGVFVTRIDIRNVGIDAPPEEVKRILELVNGPAEAVKLAAAKTTEAEARANAIRLVGQAEGAAAEARVKAYAAAGERIGVTLAQGDSLATALGKVGGLRQLVLGSNDTSVILGPPTEDTDEDGTRGTPKGTNPPPPNPPNQQGQPRQQNSGRKSYRRQKGRQ
jgi:hypothetical protein